MERLCRNCKHYKVLIEDEPCYSCGVPRERRNWTPKDGEGKHVFQVGDKARVIRVIATLGGFKVGDIVIVDSVRKGHNRPYVVSKVVGDMPNVRGCCDGDCLAPLNEFKVGDRAKVVSLAGANGAFQEYINVGDVVTIIPAHEDSYLYRVKNEDGYPGHCHAHNLAPLTESVEIACPCGMKYSVNK